MERSKIKKIALFIPLLEGGGAERVIVNLANEFSGRGHETDLVLVQKRGPYLRKVRSGVNIVDLGKRSTPFALAPLVRYLKETKPDVLLSTLNHANIIALIAKKLSFSRTQVIIRQSNHFSLSCGDKKRAFLAKGLYKKADKVIANSQGVKKDLCEALRIPEKKIKVIYNPVFEESIVKKAKKSPHHPFFTNKNNKVIIAVGRLTGEKNFSTLIESFARMKEDAELTESLCGTDSGELKLIILGEGEKRGALERLVEDRGLKDSVSLPGFVENPYAFMGSSEVSVLSSIWEGFGNVIVEALACGIPVVSTDCPSGPSEILENGKYGKLVPVGDAELMAEAIKSVLKSHTQKEILIERAKEFSIGKITDRYLEVFSSSKA